VRLVSFCPASSVAKKGAPHVISAALDTFASYTVGEIMIAAVLATLVVVLFGGGGKSA